MRCAPSWRCLRYGCPRCDRERRLQAERKDATKRIGAALREMRASDRALRERGEEAARRAAAYWNVDLNLPDDAEVN